MSQTGYRFRHVQDEQSGAWHVGYVMPNGAALPLTWRDAINALGSGALGPFMDEVLKGSPHAPYLFWETPPFSRQVRWPALHLVRAKTQADCFMYPGSRVVLRIRDVACAAACQHDRQPLSLGATSGRSFAVGKTGGDFSQPRQRCHVGLAVRMDPSSGQQRCCTSWCVRMSCSATSAGGYMDCGGECRRPCSSPRSADMDFN